MKRTKPLPDRLWAKVRRTDGCWEWTGARSDNGYGLISLGGRRRPVRAHRVAYSIVHGRIAHPLQIDHLCRNRACVNPDHLEAVTQRENLLRGQGLPAIHARKTHCKYGHPFDEKNTINLTRGERVCATCHNNVRRAWRHRKREALRAAA